MSNALKDQLLKAGLADAKKLKAIKKDKHKQKVQAGKKTVVNEASVLAEQKRQQQVERDRQLNQEKQVLLQQKAIAAQVKQLIATHTINAKGEVAYNFTDGTLIKRLYVNAKLHDELSRGLVAIAKQDDNYALVPAAVAEKISQRQPESIVLLNIKQQQPEEDDPYAEFQVPDDLMW